MGQPPRVIRSSTRTRCRCRCRWLGDLGLADLSGAADGLIRLDSRVSGVGDRVPLPLARSQHDAGVRLTEMDEVGVSHHAVSMPPFLFCSTADDGGLVRDVIDRGNTELAAYVAGAQDRLIALGSIPRSSRCRPPCG